MIKRLGAVLIASALVCAAPMQSRAGELAGFVALPLTGDLEFDLGGLDVEFLAGRFVKSVTASGNTLTIVQQLADGTEQTTIYTPTGGGGGGSSDGVLVSASFDDTTKMVTLNLSTGTMVLVDLSELATTDDVDDAIATALAGIGGLSESEVDARIATYARVTPSGTIADAQIPAGIARDTELPDTSTYLERSDVVAGTNVTIQNGAGNSFTIAASGGGGGTDDQTAAEVPVTTTDFNGNLSGTDNDVQAALETIDDLSLGAGGGLTAVSSDSTLDGDGTAGDPLGLTDVEVNQLDSVPGLLAETADLSIEVISRTWTDGTDVAAGGFVSHGSGNAITVAEAAALTYYVTRAVTNADAQLNFVVIRVPDTVDLRDVRTRQRIGGGVDLYIDGWHRIGSAGGFTYAYSHHHLYSGYTARFQTAATLSTTHFRGESVAENVTVDASGFSGNLTTAATDVQAFAAEVDALTLGGGGGVTGTGEQRIESVTFANITNITATATTLTLATTTPIAVEFGDGAATMLSGTGGATTFTIADAGVYLFVFAAVYPADGDRATPFIEIQDNSDDSVIGRSTNTYLRNTGSPDDSLIIAIDGVVTVPTANLEVKAVLGNAYNQNNLDASGGTLSLVRIGTGLTGAAGATGATGPAGTGGDDAATWAEAGNTTTIPTAKYGTATIPGTGLENLSVGNGQLSNFIDGAKISTETIGHGKLHSETSGFDEDLHAVMVATGVGAVRWDTGRLCPDAATGTAGQVCAVNTGATAYELVDQTGGDGGGSTTYLGLTDTPAAFGTAGQVVAVNTGGDALVFTDAGAGGAGDITAVTTANNTGLAGGASTGAVALELDIANLPEVTAVTSISTTDRVAVESVVNSSETRKVTLDNIFTDFASTGIGALAGGGHFFDPTEIVSTSVVAANDNLIIEDESNSTNAARTVSVSLFAASLADGTTITASGGVLSSVSGGPTVTDTAIADDATTESTTDGASRQAIAEMRDGERHIRYHTTLPEAVDIPDDQTDDIHVLLDSDGNAISLYHFSIVEETEEWLLTVGVGLGVRGYAAGISSGYGHISPNGPNVGFTALNRSTNGRFILTYNGATTGLVRADSRTLYIRQRGTDGNWHVVQMDEIATPYEYVSTTNGHNFTFREGTAYNVIVRRAADTNDGGNITAVLTGDRDIAFEDGASLVQLADVQDLLHIGEVVEVVYQQVAGLAAAEVAVDASAFTGNLSTLDIDAQTAFATIDGLTLGGAGGTATEATFKGALASTSTTAAAYANVFTITEAVNVGGFSIETDVSVAGSQVVRVPVAGRYRSCADVAFTQTTASNNNARIGGHTRLAEVEDATTITADGSHGTGYARSINNGLVDSSAAVCTVLDLELGDDVAVQFQAEVEAGTMSIDGGSVSLVLVGGLTGATGSTGPAGVDGGTDNQTAAEVAVSITNFSGNLVGHG